MSIIKSVSQLIQLLIKNQVGSKALSLKKLE